MIDSTEKFWDTVYRRNIRRLIGICYRYTANQPLSQDLAHDAFVKAMDKSGSFQGKGCFDAWLRRIVVNHVLQYLREQKNKTYLDVWMQPESSMALIEDPTSNAVPSQGVDFSEQDLLEAINTLPKHHRLVFNLYVLDNFTHAQIGQALGISAGTSKSHLASARKKIKLLLTEKATKKGDKKDRKRVLFPFLFPYKLLDIDQLYRQRFDQLEIPSGKDIGVDPIPYIRRPVSESTLRIVSGWHYIMGITSVAFLSTILFFAWNAHSWQDRLDTTTATSTIVEEDKDPGLVQENRKDLKADEIKEKVKTIHVRENNSILAHSNTATLFPDRIIGNKNLTNKTMKKIDSLAIMLLVSSSSLFDSVAQPNYKNDFPKTIQTQILAQKGRPMMTSEVIETGKEKVKNKGEKGIFYASSLFWSGENKEVYLHGKVRVKFGDNNFKGDGSFTFLGPVELLIINDTPATMDATVELSNQAYKLSRLTSQEATQKYGEKGRQGAVEISFD